MQLTCRNCNKTFEATTIVNGEKVRLYKRKFCFDCSPYGTHNTSKFPRSIKPAFIDSLSEEEFSELIKSSISRRDFFRKVGMSSSGRSHDILNRRIEKENADTSHFLAGNKCRKLTNKIPYEEILIKNSTYSSTPALKRRLVQDGIIEYRCALCKNPGQHQGLPLGLQLDHKNGDRCDNRIENLRLLCPNCHSQTETFCGRGKKKKQFK